MVGLQRSILVVSIWLVIALALLAVAFAASGSEATRAAKNDFQTPRWGFVCEYRHSAEVDPIVYPGRYGLAHRHDFFGGKVRPDSGRDQLRANYSGCHFGRTTNEEKNADDHSGYWLPTLYRGDEVVEPYNANVYYHKTRGEHAARVKPVLRGLRIIAGARHHATKRSRHVGWGCAERPVRLTPRPEDCPAGHMLRVSIRFPSCMEADPRKDSRDHRAHMRYPTANGCPKSHPRPVPQLELVVRYRATDGDGLSLSSGPVRTMHADFMEAHGKYRMNERMDRCLNGGKRCGLDGTVS